MRTYSRDTFQAAQRAWVEGRFADPRWARIRRLSAEAGFIFPPAGTAHDDRDDERPSQRAIVWAAMNDTPRELERIIRVSGSWSEVVARIIGDMEERREPELFAGHLNEPSTHEARTLLRNILRELAR